MTYSLITGGEKWTQVASIAGWKTFREWVEEIESDDIDELRHLVEYGWSQKLPDLSEQLTETLSSGNPSADVKDIGQTVLAALEDAPDGAESAVLTDGLASIDDPDDSGWSSTEDEEDEPAEPDTGKGIESGDIETPEGIPPPLSRKAIEKAHVARVSKREEEASRDLARFFQGAIKTLSQRVAKSGFAPDPSKDARKQAEAILKKAFDPKEHLKGLVRAIAPHLAASFCVGAGAELELTKQAAIRKKARGWDSRKYSEDQPRDDHGRFGSGGSSTADVDASVSKLKQDPGIKELLDMPSGSKGKTVGQHTDQVLANWKDRADPKMLSQLSDKYGVDMPKLMGDAILLHDIGKGLAVQAGDREMQHHFTKPIMEDVLKFQGYGDKEVAIANALVAHDIVGNAVKGMSGLETEAIAAGEKFLSPSEGAAALQQKAAEAGMDKADFVKLQQTFYESDASSYKYLQQNVFEKDASGKLQVKYDAYHEMLKAASGEQPVASTPAPTKQPTGEVYKQAEQVLSQVEAATGMSKQDIAKAFHDKAISKQDIVARTKVMDAIAKSGTAIPDAATHVLEYDAATNAEAKAKYLASVIVGKGDVKAAIQNMSSLPLHDLQATPTVDVFDKPKGGEASCNVATGKIELGKGYKLGTPRHELGHAIDHLIRGTRGGGSPELKKQITEDYQRAIAAAEKLNANWKHDPSFDNKKLGHEWFEEKLGIGGRRDLDSDSEHFAEEYRLMHREIYRDKHEGGNGKFLTQWRQRHPGYAKIFDTYYTASLVGIAAAKGDK